MNLRIALAGNPNCGKTTLFNALTGSNQFVGNWPGVTVEKKDVSLTSTSALYNADGTQYTGTDFAIEAKLDSLFTEPWRGYEVENLTGFLGNYCHGNQPGHSIPYMYALIGRQEKTQEVLNYIMDNFYDMGAEGLALAGMDDAGEMTSWYVLNAIGIYTYSPADPENRSHQAPFRRQRLQLQ